MQELLQSQCDMRVFKYLQGETNLNQEMPETSFIGSLFKKYLMDNYRYKSIKNLKTNHSFGNLIDESIVELENAILNINLLSLESALITETNYRISSDESLENAISNIDQSALI
jgi:hypothetical protein